MKQFTFAAGIIAQAVDQQPPLISNTVDVTEFAKPFFDVPVYFSRDVWELCLAMNHADEFRQGFRIKSLLVQSKIHIKNACPQSTELAFVIRLRVDGSISGHERHRLLAKAIELNGALALLLALDNKPRLVAVRHD